MPSEDVSMIRMYADMMIVSDGQGPEGERRRVVAVTILFTAYHYFHQKLFGETGGVHHFLPGNLYLAGHPGPSEGLHNLGIKLSPFVS